MADKDADSIQYTRIAGIGSRYGFFLRYIIGNQLFMGAGHLVSVTYTGMPMYEKYVRFYFNDIISIVYGPTARQGVYYGIIAFFWISIMLIFALIEYRPLFLWGGAICTILALVLCVINYTKGERCRFFIRTAVQDVEIPAIGTMHQARDVMALLAPMIQDAQQKSRRI